MNFDLTDKKTQSLLFFHSIEIRSLDLLLALWHLKEKTPNFSINQGLLFRAFKVITNDINDYLRLLREIGNPPVKEISDIILKRGDAEQIRQFNTIVASWHSK